MRLTRGPPGGARGRDRPTRPAPPERRSPHQDLLAVDQTRARLSPDRSTPPRAPPAAFSASTTRDPGSRTAIPGRRTFPATSTVTEPVVAGPAARAPAVPPGRPDGAAVARARTTPSPRPASPRPGRRSRRLPRTTHQQVTARPRAIRRASTVTCGGPRATRPRSVGGTAAATRRPPAATRAVPGPAPPERAAGRPRPEGRRRRAPPGAQWSRAVLGSSGRGAVDRPAGTPPARRSAGPVAGPPLPGARGSVVGCAWGDARKRPPPAARPLASPVDKPPPGRLWRPGGLDVAQGRGARRPRACPGPTWAPSTAPSSPYQISRPERLSASRRPSRSVSCAARSGLARCATHRSICCPSAGLHRQLLEPAQRLGRECGPSRAWPPRRRRSAAAA